jgi:uncharacterized protein (DUF952 family)
MAGDTIYKICTASEWRTAKAAGAFAGSPDDARDGFIHLSAEDQVTGTLERHFRDRADLVILAVDPARLSEDMLKWEASRGGALFPHLYGPLPVSAVRSAERLEDSVFAREA